MEIKRILENINLENSKLFSLEINLPDALEIYNNNIHSSTKFKPIELFRTNNIDVINLALENIKNSQKKFNKNNNGFKKGCLCLICENYCLKDKSIGFKKFTKKDKYSIPCIIKGIKGGNEYIYKLPFGL